MKKGYTLIELLVVIAIIGALSSFVLATLNKDNNREGANYKICNSSDCYYVESYTKENQGRCVYLSEEEVRLCGDFSIKNLQE